MTTTTDTTGAYTATSDGCAVRIEHRDGADTVLLDTLLTGPIRDERELADLLDTYLAGA